MIWIKICGTTSLEDAQAAVEAGADALGFIFAPSPRRIRPTDAARITLTLPRTVEKIGVFVNQTAEIIAQTVQEAQLTGVQLHGDETPRDVEKLKRTFAEEGSEIAIFKAIRAGRGFALTLEEYQGEGAPDAFLLDSGNAAARGGTGERFDWQESPAVIKLAARRYRIVIAGGLNAGNVSEAIDAFCPYGIDVVTGVEREPGKKDRAKLQAFIRAARAMHVVK